MKDSNDFDPYLGKSDEYKSKHDLTKSQEHFRTSNEPLVNGVPLSKYLANKAPPEEVEEEIENLGAEGICLKCKEWTEVGNSCCGDDYVHID